AIMDSKARKRLNKILATTPYKNNCGLVLNQRSLRVCNI
ncbi:MAG: hypothetical protein ACI921_001553, partial [Polaribacter sp.]